MTEITYFLRGNKRYAPPFRIIYSRRRNIPPFIVKDGRDTRVGSFSKWPYAFACLQALHHQAGLPPPINDTAKHQFEMDVWLHMRKYPNSNPALHINNPVVKYLKSHHS